MAPVPPDPIDDILLKSNIAVNAKIGLMCLSALIWSNLMGALLCFARDLGPYLFVLGLGLASGGALAAKLHAECEARLLMGEADYRDDRRILFHALSYALPILSISFFILGVLNPLPQAG